MALDITCPNCATDEHLRGRRDGDGDVEVIVIRCDACGLTWQRPAVPHCPSCGRTDVVVQPVPVIEKSRGTQLSITAMHVEFLCPICDIDQLRAPHDGHLPPALGQG